MCFLVVSLSSNSTQQGLYCESLAPHQQALLSQFFSIKIDVFYENRELIFIHNTPKKTNVDVKTFLFYLSINNKSSA